MHEPVLLDPPPPLENLPSPDSEPAPRAPNGAPDPDRLGGLRWTRRTGGRLTPRERRALLGAIAAGQVENVLGRVKLALGRLPERAGEVDVTAFKPPDSRLSREAEAACAEQPALIAGHSYRTWMYGLALAAVDRVDLDRELFYCASLVHDHGIVPAVPGRDFTLGGADRALRCAADAGLPANRAELIADAICVHPTPGIGIDSDGPLGCYVQWGAMVDGAGLRAWDVSKANRQAVLSRYPRSPGFKAELSGMIRAEAAAVPGGRFGLLVRCGLTTAVRLAPFEP